MLLRALFMDIADLPVTMVSGDVPRVEPHTAATAVRRLMRSTGARVVAVVSRDRLQGVIYRSTILALSSAKAEATAKDIMEDPPFTLTPSMKVGDAVDLMFRYDEWYGFIVDEGMRYVGVLGLENIIEVTLREHAEDLARNKVEDIMTKDVVKVTPDDPLSRIWNLMRDTRYAGFPVVDEKGRLVGIITQYDLIKKGYSRIELESESGPRRGPKVREAMTTGVISVYPWTTVKDLAQNMISRGYGRFPVVNSPSERILVGIVDREDVVRFIVGRR